MNDPTLLADQVGSPSRRSCVRRDGKQFAGTDASFFTLSKRKAGGIPPRAIIQAVAVRDADHLGNDPTLLADQVGRLVRADVGHASLQYRLLETTRAYALEKLAESGELETTSPIS